MLCVYWPVQELLQFFVAFQLMSECGTFVAGHYGSHFTEAVLSFICGKRREGCPATGYLFGTGTPDPKSTMFDPTSTFDKSGARRKRHHT
jgi:hypothetical protein